MATSNSHASINRFFDVNDEPRNLFQFIDSYQSLSMPTLEEAIEPVVQLCPDIRRRASIAKEYVKTRGDGLTEDESASIYLYTNEWSPREECLYYVLNSSLRSRNQQTLIQPWLLIMKILLTALFKLPPCSTTVWRCAPLDLRKEFAVGQTYTWWGFSSCIESDSILKSEIFLGQKGKRTMFSIECFNGKDIHDYSSLEAEDEILLLPGSQFIVKHHLQPSEKDPDLITIHLEQVEPRYPVLEEPVPGLPRSQVTSSTAVRASSMYQFTSYYFVSRDSAKMIMCVRSFLITKIFSHRYFFDAYTVKKRAE